MVGESLSKSQQNELEDFLAETITRDTDSRVVVILTQDQISPPLKRLSQYSQFGWATAYERQCRSKSLCLCAGVAMSRSG